MTRGELIRTGTGGALFLGIASCAPVTYDDERTMLRVICGAMLDGALPAGSNLEESLNAAVDGVKIAIAGLPPSMQREVGQLFALLRFPLTRAFAAHLPQPWSQVSPQDAAAFLERWRTSNTLLFRTGYQALHQLVFAGWYGGDAAWQATGYLGPPSIN
jgi:hypothetical protein